MESEYRSVKEATMRYFFVFILMLLILIFAVVFVVACIRNLRGYIIGLACAVAFLIVVIVYGLKVGRYTGIILSVICLTYYMYSGISSRKFIEVPLVNAFWYSGFGFAAFERIVVHELPRLEFKLFFGLMCFLTRMIWLRPMDAGTIITQVIYYVMFVFIDCLRERKDRSIFKEFYDYREELVKFKNLMVTGLPTNILILTRDMKKKLFSNEYFNQTFETKLPFPTVTWDPQEWLTSLKVEKDSTADSANNSPSNNTLNGSVDLEQYIQTLIEKKLLSTEGHQFSIRSTANENEEEKIFMVKVFSLIWDKNDAVAIILSDITQQHTNFSLKIANANKDKMIAMVSHELRTPLNGILGMIQIMEKQVSDENMLTYLNICKNSGKLLLSIVNSILDLGQIRNNKLKLCVTKTDLSELLSEIYYMFEFQFKQKELYLRADTMAGVSQYIYTDKNRLKQVLINLVGNALKFTFHGGVNILVDEAHHEGFIEFRVSDTGVGIKEEDKEKLFQMYGKLDQTDHKLNTEGVGLGLTISNFLVKLLSKEDEGIKVQSKFDEGTTLSFSIKADLEHEDSDVSEIMSKRPSDAERNQRLGTFEKMRLDDPEFHLEEGSGSISFDDRENVSKKMPTYQLDTRVHMVSEAARINSESLSNLCLTNHKQEDKLPSSSNDIENLDTETNHNQLHLSTKHDLEMGTKKPPSDEPLMKKTVLLVDDSPFNIMVAKHLIESLGYTVKTALNGSLAIKAVKEASQENKTKLPFNIIMMDCQMPVMDGYEATKALRKLMLAKEIPTIPIIALSANDSDNDKKRSKSVGMCDHLTKPVNESILKDALKKYCR
jgi:signal transduction histidine kinase/CheY-like chemotaxis protein